MIWGGGRLSLARMASYEQLLFGNLKVAAHDFYASGNSKDETQPCGPGRNRRVSGTLQRAEEHKGQPCKDGRYK